MKWSAEKHAKVANAYRKDASAPGLTPQQRQELERAAARHQALANHAKKPAEERERFNENFRSKVEDALHGVPGEPVHVPPLLRLPRSWR